MKVIVTGASGAIGSHLVPALLERGHRITVFDHHKPAFPVTFVEADLGASELPAEHFKDVDAVIHLAGRNIFAKWDAETKRQIYDSRILGTRSLVAVLSKLDRRPRVLVSASAVGFYGERGEEELDESSTAGGDFLARVCVDWEREARKVEALGMRSVQVRTAPVIGKGGMLSKIEPIYRWGLGGPLGSGRQWFPWIHVRDVVGVYIKAVEDASVSGPVNACAPGLVRNVEFSRTLASVLRRPHLFFAPRWALRLMLGELSSIVLASQKVQPARLIAGGYSFACSDIRSALEEVYRRPAIL
ncbi:MAG: TIGR01777 family oxidoreductase [Dehalococcoidia bacterium]|nr:TIGR01777 family oxidoreductase [Dehalococcoidia bacterium]